MEPGEGGMVGDLDRGENVAWSEARHRPPGRLLGMDEEPPRKHVHEIMAELGMK